MCRAICATSSWPTWRSKASASPRAPEEKAEYTLRGYVVSSLEKKGTKSKVSYIWDVTDASGKGVHRVSGEESAPAGKSKDPWTAVTPAIVQTIASKTVTSVTAWMPGGGAAPRSPAAAPQAAWCRRRRRPRAPIAATTPAKPTVTGSIGTAAAVKALVPVVTGAPGDGSTTLQSSAAA